MSRNRELDALRLSRTSILILEADTVRLRAERRPFHTQLTLLALDADAVTSACAHAHAAGCDALCVQLLKVECDGCEFVYACQGGLHHARSDLRGCALVAEYVGRQPLAFRVRCPRKEPSSLWVLEKRDHLPGKRVQPKVEQGSAAQLGVIKPVLGIRVEANRQVAEDTLDLAEHALLVDQSLNLERDGEEACPDCFHQEEAFGFGDFDQVLGLGGIDREWFLKQVRECVSSNSIGFKPPHMYLAAHILSSL